MLRRFLAWLKFLWFWLKSKFRRSPRITLRRHVQLRSPRRQLKLALRKGIKKDSGRQWVKMRKALKRGGLDIMKVRGAR